MSPGAPTIDEEATEVMPYDDPMSVVDYAAEPESADDIEAEPQAITHERLPVRILVGSGGEKRVGWIHIDADPLTDPDILASVPPYPYGNPKMPRRGNVDTIEAIHFLACLSEPDGRQFLEESYDLLAPNGELIIETPNVEICMRQFLRRVQVSTRHEHLYGLHGIYGESDNEQTRNKWGYSPASLERLLRDVGFHQVKEAPALYHLPGRDFRMIAVK